MNEEDPEVKKLMEFLKTVKSLFSVNKKQTRRFWTNTYPSCASTTRMRNWASSIQIS
jgi:hypothetical protein